MLEKLGNFAGTALLGVGMVVGAAEPVVPPALTAAPRLTATVMAMGGLGHENVSEDLIKRVLGGRYADEEKLVGLPWPGELAPFNGTLTLNESVTAGIPTMEEAIRTTAGKKIVAGASGSTLVVDEVMARLATDPSAPPADELSFVVLGDANRGMFAPFRGVTLPIFDYTVPAIPVTKYDVLVVSGEYDGMSDWPDRSWNLIADLNALAGTGILQQVLPEDIVETFKLEAWGSVHYDAMFADLSKIPPENITTSTNALGGVTTSYLVPTADLPLLRPLTAMGVPPQIVGALQSVLRPIVDSAYLRNDPFGRNSKGWGGRVSQPREVATSAAVRARSAASRPQTAATRPESAAGPGAARAACAKATGARPSAASARSAGRH